MSPFVSPVARQAVAAAAHTLQSQGLVFCTPPQLFQAATDAAWDAGLLLTNSDVWGAVYEWGGYDYDFPPPDDIVMALSADGRDVGS